MRKRRMIRGHVVEITDDGRLLVDGDDYTDEFDGRAATRDTFHEAVRRYERNEA